MKNCVKKTFLWSNFYYHGNDMIHIMKIYTTNHSHCHQLVLLTKRAVMDWVSKSSNRTNSKGFAQPKSLPSVPMSRYLNKSFSDFDSTNYWHILILTGNWYYFESHGATDFYAMCSTVFSARLQGYVCRLQRSFLHPRIKQSKHHQSS